MFSGFYRFVEFSTIREATTAIQLLNGFDMGNNTRLVVKISETPEQKESRISKPDSFSFEETDSMVDNVHSNPLIPKYKSVSLQSPDQPKPILGSMPGTPLSPVGGATSLNALSSTDEKEQRLSVKTNANPSVNGSDSVNNLPCHVCNTLTYDRCSKCKTPYCSVNCQKNDWPKHKLECKLIQSGSIGSDSLSLSVEPHTPPQNTQASNSLFDESGDSFDELYVDEDPKYKSLGDEIRFSDETQSELTDVTTAPFSDDSIPTTQDSEVFQRPFFNDRCKEPEGVTLQEILSQYSLVSDSQPLPLLPLEAERIPKDFPMIVTYYYDAMRFSAVPASSETFQAFNKIREFGSQSDHSPEYSSNPGTICGYKDKTGAFYRIKIIHPPSQTVELFDTGFRPKLPFTNFVKLSDEISSIPSLVKTCSFYNVYLNSEIPGGSKYMKDIVNLNPIRVHVQNKYVVNQLKIFFCCPVLTLDRQINICDKFIASPFCSQGRKDHKSSIQQDPLLKSVSKIFSTHTRQFSNESDYKPVQMASEVPFHCPPTNLTLIIVPKVILNPNLIWAQVMHSNFSIFHKMQADINALSQASVTSSYIPSVGEMVIVKFFSMQSFYRAEVLCVNHDETVDVQFVDLGNRQTVSIEQLHYIQSQFLTLPKQALRFSLAGLEPANATKTWNDATIILLRDKILNRRVQVNIMTFTNGTYEVEMYDPEDPSLTVNNILVQKGLASVDIRRLAMPTTPMTLNANISGVSVSSRSSPLLPTTAGKSLLHSLTSFPNKSCDFQSLFTQSHDMTISPMKKGVLNSPHQAMSPVSTSDTPSLNSDTLDVEELLTPSNKTQPSLLTSSTNDNEIRNKAQSSLAINVCQSPSGSVTNDCQSLSVGSKLTSRIEYNELEENVTFPVTVTHIENPYNFWVQLLTKPAVNKLLSLYNKINKTELIPTTSLSAGSACLCRFSEDNQVHRACIHSLGDDSAVVTYIDFGNSETVPLDCLYSIGSDLVLFRQLATSCTINSLLNPQGKASQWSKDAVDFFKDMVLNKEVEMTVVRCMGRKHVVEIVVDTDQGKKQMLDLFSENKLGHKLTRKTDSSKPQKSRFLSSSPKSRDLSSSPQKLKSGFEHRSNDAAKNFPKNEEHFTREQSSSIVQQNTNNSIKKFIRLSPAKPSIVYPKVSDLPQNVLPSEVFQVVASNIESPAEFYIQVATSENAQVLDKLSSDLNDQFSSSPPTPLKAPPPNDSLVAAKFSDGLWYRAEVLTSSPTSCEVRFIDFGNQDTVNLNNMAVCPEEFLSVPCFASRCGLFGIESPNPDKTIWSKKAIEQTMQLMSDKILSAQVVSCSSPFPLLHLRDSSTDLDIALDLVDKGFALSKKSSSPPRKQNVDLHPSVNILKKVELPSGVFKVLVSECVSPGEVYVQLASSELLLQFSQILEHLNAKFSPSIPQSHVIKAPPSKGSLCVAKFSDGAWYRAEVLASSSTSCEVKFVDYGNKDTIELDCLAVCPEECLSAPCFTVQCVLAGVECPNPNKTWSKEAIAYFKQTTADKLLKAKVVSVHPVSGIPLIKLKDPAIKTSENVSSELIRLGYALSPGGASPNTQTKRSEGKSQIPSYEESTSSVYQPTAIANHPNIPVKTASPISKPTIQASMSSSSPSEESFISTAYLPKQPLPKVGDLKTCDLPSGAFQVVISELVSPQEMYAQLATTEVATMLDKLSNDLNEKLSNSAISLNTRTPPTKGSLVAAKFSDGVWYRAEVLTSSPTSCEVKFIDFGNKDTVNLNNMAICPEEFLTAPCLTVCCGLIGIESCNSDKSLWPDKSITYLKNATRDKLLQAEVVDMSSVPLLKLCDPDGPSDISHAMIEQGFAIDSTSVTTVLPDKMFSLPSNAFKLVVSEVTSPAELYIQVATLENAQVLDKLSSDLNDRFSSSPPTPLKAPPPTGSLVAAKFSDGVWYRAEVLTSSPTSCEVRFIDFGNQDTVNLNNMAICPEEFVSIPCLSICCCLDSVVSPSGDPYCWPEESIAGLKQLVSDKLMKAKVVRNDALPVIKIIQEDSVGKGDVSFQMIQQGWAMDPRMVSEF